MKTRQLALTANLAAIPVALRIIKHNIVGAIPIINFPVAFALISGALLGPLNGFIVGLLSFLVSDIFLGLGYWTIFTSLTCGIIGLIGGLMWRGRNPCRLELLAVTLMLTFTYDILTSILLYAIFMPLQEAVIMGLIGLFLPAMGGTLYAMGPIVEVSTAILVSILLPKVRGVRINEG
ncbi:MAG: ECF transporter S component [archaeon YNP-WB-062]|nr:ECF transporter S component [Candidatus Culexarchaeum yellowstonense]